MAELLERELGDVLTFEYPKGGMFLWARFREPRNCAEWMKKTLEQGVVFVPGEFFYADNPDPPPSVCLLPPRPKSKCTRPLPA